MNENEIEKRILEIDETLKEIEDRGLLLYIKKQEAEKLFDEFYFDLEKEKNKIITNLKKEMNGLQYDERNNIIRLINYVEKKNIF
jgi:hypothetical protein